MIKISIKKLEHILDIRIKKNCSAFGVDTATISGIALVRTDDTDVHITPDLLDMSKIKSQQERFDIAYGYFSEILKNNKVDFAVVEDVFFGRNVKALIFMTRIGMIVYALCRQLNIPSQFILASQARCKLNLPSKAKKEEVQEEFSNTTGINFADNNVIDAVILGIVGVLK
jgi:Holliday junction resolvasome RuvABC endonuclease subunit